VGPREIRQGQVRFLLLKRPVSHMRGASSLCFCRKRDYIVLSEVEFILQEIACVSQLHFDDPAGHTVAAEAFESLLAGLFYRGMGGIMMGGLRCG